MGQNGMVVAAKVLAVTAEDLFTNPVLIQEAKAELQRRLKGQTYRSNIPADQKPPLDYRKSE
jgi:aminobenzoyl-glutamate utilization protein B